MTDSTLSVQYLSEANQLDAGKYRYELHQQRVEKDKGYGAINSATKVSRACIPLVSLAIKSTLKDTKDTRETSAKFLLKQLDPDLLAFLTLNVCFNCAKGAQTLNNVIISLGKHVEGETWAKVLRDKDLNLYVRLLRKTSSSHSSLKYRKKALRAIAAKEGYKPLDWANDLKARIGALLLDALLVALPEVFETYLEYDTTGTTPMSFRRLGVTREGLDLLENIQESLSWTHPVFRPMVMKPRPWTDFRSGAYYTEELRYHVPLIRTFDREHIALVEDAITKGSMAKVLEAVNAIQDTSWSINKPLLDLVKWAWGTNQGISGFPLHQHVTTPPLPDNWELQTDARKKGWRIEAAKVAVRNRGIDSDIINMDQDLRVATNLCDYDCFYLPHSLDFRGRVYPVPSFNTQRADHIRSLFQFTKGKVLDQEGAYWLAIHLANCGDFDGLGKKSFKDRYEWVVNNEALIKEVANDPKGTFSIWKEADKPFQFVAVCIEYSRYLANGDGTLSRIPVALDGSNSGLQHYSASLRSPEGALVNLTPSSAPADLYQMVANETKILIQEDLANPLAQTVLDNGVTRKLVKRNAMTFSYSSGEFGFKQQHMEDLMRPLDHQVLSGALPTHPYGDDGGFRAASYIAKKVYKAITGLVKDAVTGMKFFQDCARVLAHEGKGLTWVTPLGLPVTHKYTDWDVKEVQLFLHDKAIPVSEATSVDKIDDDCVMKRIKLAIRTKPSTRVNKTKAKSAVAPNVIHSMDASHLLSVVLLAKASGIEEFSLIHDSFGTHASSTPVFTQVIRQAFVTMYENYCPYDTISGATSQALTDKSKLPATPIKGNLNVQTVLASDYAFA